MYFTSHPEELPRPIASALCGRARSERHGQDVMNVLVTIAIPGTHVVITMVTIAKHSHNLLMLMIIIAIIG